MRQKKQLSFRPAAPDELQIDLDRPRARIPKRLLRLVSEHMDIKKLRYSRSRSGNSHATVNCGIRFGVQVLNALGIPWQTVQDFDEVDMKLIMYIENLERCFLNLALGSDPVRELLSWGRARNGCPYPTLFFEEKKK